MYARASSFPVVKRCYFLLKTEPDEYGWEHLVAQKVGRWDGVRNFAARNQLRAMKRGDLAFFYHTGKAREIVGVVEIVREHYPDPTANGADFSCVDVAPVCSFTKSVSLAAIKATPSLAQMILVRRARLSVQPVTPTEFAQVLKMGETKLPVGYRLG